MWWTGIYGKKHKNYSAQGVGNQAIIVYPKENLVIINRTDTYQRKSVKTADLKKLAEMIFEEAGAAYERKKTDEQSQFDHVFKDAFRSQTYADQQSCGDACYRVNRPIQRSPKKRRNNSI